MGTRPRKDHQGWVIEAYAKLWEQKQTNEFTYPEAKEILGHMNFKQVRALLPRLQRCGWACAKPNPENMNRKIYTLKPPDEAMMATAKLIIQE